MSAPLPPPPEPLKVMCFLDFWNYELTMAGPDGLEPGFLTDWYKLPPVLVQLAALRLGRTVTYERLFIAGSYDAGSKKDTGLYRWANTVLAHIPGVYVDFSPRQQRTAGPKCTGPNHCETQTCPSCGASMLGTMEKGVDTRLVTEMLDTALGGQCDAIILVSADKDFIPAVDKLTSKNIKCIHAFFPHYGYELGKRCWAQFDLFAIREQFRR